MSGAGVGPEVTVFVPAKVNLDLRVGPLRPDGYHSLSTVYHAVDILDEVTVRPAEDWSVEVEGAHAHRVPSDSDNLALRAARLLAEQAGDDGTVGPVAIRISKSIPVAGGMAGGSADAAAALVACDELWGLGCTRAHLEEIAARLGSDVGFLLTGGTALGSQRGEHVAPVLTQGSFHWVFVLSDEGLSTPECFAELDRLRADEEVPEPEPPAELLAALRLGDVRAVAAHLGNDMQQAALSLRPSLSRAREVGLQHGALAALVSGSGPTVALLTDSRTAALDLMVALSAEGVGDAVVHARGPAPGAHVVRTTGCALR